MTAREQYETLLRVQCYLNNLIDEVEEKYEEDVFHDDTQFPELANLFNALGDYLDPLWWQMTEEERKEVQNTEHKP